MSTPQTPTAEKIVETPEADQAVEARTVEAGKVVRISEEEFKLLNSVEATDPAWQNFLKLNELDEGKTYEFRITDEEGNERVGAYGTDAHDHLTRDIALTAELEARQQEEGEESPESAEVLNEEASEGLGELAVGETVEVEKEPTERRLSERDTELVHSMVDDIERMARVYGAEHSAAGRQDELVSQLAQSVIERFKDGQVGEEANAFLMGLAMGSLKDGQTMHAIFDRIERSGKVAQAELDVMKSKMQFLEEQGRARNEERAAALSYLEKEMQTLLEKNDYQPDNATLVLSGMIAGLSTQLAPQDYSYGESKRSAAVSDLGRLKK